MNLYRMPSSSTSQVRCSSTASELFTQTGRDAQHRSRRLFLNADFYYAQGEFAMLCFGVTRDVDEAKSRLENLSEIVRQSGTPSTTQIPALRLQAMVFARHLRMQNNSLAEGAASSTITHAGM